LAVAAGLPTGIASSVADCRTIWILLCRDNEVGYMFFHNLGGSVSQDLTVNQTVGDVTLTNIQRVYWSATERSDFAGWEVGDGELASAKAGMVSSANPHATAAGQRVLAEGGSAIDAAVVVQMVLGVVEPQSSGIGGGAFLLHYHAEDASLTAWDGRETAPASATPELFMQDGEPLHFLAAVPGGRSVGTPGVVRMLAAAHAEGGRLPWSRLFDEAITLAEGFEMSPWLHHMARRDPAMRTMPGRELFYDDNGHAKPVGARVENPELAEVLRALRDQGPDPLYRGAVAEDIVAAVRAASRPSTARAIANYLLLKAGAPVGMDAPADVPAPGGLTLQDLGAYQPKKRTPICIEYRRWRVCGMPPPTSGGVATLQILGILSHFNLSKYGPFAPETAHLLAEAERLAYADRNLWIGDPDFVDVPTAALLDADYLAARSSLIQVDARMKNAKPGTPPGAKAARFSEGRSPERPSTSHFTIVDGAGDIVSMTTSIENPFGSRVIARGIVLNNQLTDFSFDPERDGKPVANAVAANKRPRSSMSPLIIFDAASGAPVAALGSPGGSRIIAYVTRAALGIMDFGLDPRAAIELPHIVNRGNDTELEERGWPPGALEQVQSHLERLGHDVSVTELISGLHAIALREGRVLGAADPRREGSAKGTDVRPKARDEALPR